MMKHKTNSHQNKIEKDTRLKKLCGDGQEVPKIHNGPNDFTLPVRTFNFKRIRN